MLIETTCKIFQSSWCDVHQSARTNTKLNSQFTVKQEIQIKIIILFDIKALKSEKMFSVGILT
jgi:hypothetical protein